MNSKWTIFIFLITVSTFLSGIDSVRALDMETSELIYPEKILEGPDQNIYVFDSADAFIKVFSPEGKFISKLGGKGEGPGQFKRAEGADFGFTPRGGSIWFTEYFMGHPWMSFVDLEGKPGDFVHYKFTGFFGVPEAEIFRDGTIFIRVETPSRSVKKGDIYYTGYRDELQILHRSGRADSTGIARESMSTISFIRDGGDIGIPFTPRFMWALTGNGNILFSEGTSADLVLYNRKGKKIRTIRVPIPAAAPVTKNDLDQWREGLKERFRNRDRSWYKRFGSVIEKYDQSVHRYKPVIHRMDITPDDHIFLQCLTKKENTYEYLLTDLTGKPLVRSRSDISRVVLSPNYIVFQTASDEDETELSVLKRNGTEKADLKIIFGIHR